jgi:hypothetical protein
VADRTSMYQMTGQRQEWQTMVDSLKKNVDSNDDVYEVVPPELSGDGVIGRTSKADGKFGSEDYNLRNSEASPRC